MRWLGLLICALLLACLPITAAIAGTFRGVIVHPPDGEPKQGWIYVQGRNGNLRRAEVSHARVLYAATVPQRLRQKDPARALKEGTEVRVTASQDGAGEWRALQVEILKVQGSGRRKPRPKVQPATDDRAPAANVAM